MEYQPYFKFDSSVEAVPRQGLVAAVFLCIRQRKFLVAGMTLAFITISTMAIFALPESFTADGSVIIEPIGAEAVNLGRVLPESPIEASTLASEVEILTSRQLLEKVIMQNDLLTKPEFNPGLRTYRFSSIMQEVLRSAQRWFSISQRSGAEVPTTKRELDDTVSYVQRHLGIAQVGVSRVIGVSYSSPDPEMAALFVNSLMRVNVEEHVRLREQANSKAHDWI